MPTTRREVLHFLREFKTCLKLEWLEVKDRKKNRQCLIDLGLSASERREVLAGLEPEDYVAGPKPDHVDSTKEVWEFGKLVKRVGIYIKLRVVEDQRTGTPERALVWSFHPAEYPLTYPFKGGGP